MIPPQGAGYGLGDGIDEPDWVGKLLGLFGDEIAGLGGPEWRAASGLVGLLAKEDWDFLAHAVQAVSGSAIAATGKVVGEPFRPEPLVLPPPEPGPDEPVPHALVTPRMLWARFGRDTLYRVRQG